MSHKHDCYKTHWAQCHRLVTSTFGKVTWEEFEASLGYTANTCLKYTKTGAWRDGCQLRAQAALAEEPSLNLSTHRETHNCL